MASPSSSPWRRCSYRTRSNGSTITNKPSSSFPFSRSSVYICAQVNENRRARLVTTFCLRDPDSAAASSSASKLKDSVQVYGTLFDTGKDSPDSKADGTATAVDEREVAGLNRIEPKKSRILSIEALFEKRNLWKRILFASTKVRSIILLNIITLVYASNIPVIKEVEAIMDPSAFTAMRFLMSAIPFIPFVWRAKGDVLTRNAGIELGIWVSLGYLMQALGLLTSDAGRASFISMFTIIVVPLLDGMFGAKVPARTWFGAIMSIVGVAMLESSGSPPSIGDLLNFVGAIFFGIHMLRTEHITRRTHKDNILPILGYQISVVALVSTLWYLVGGLNGGFQDYDPSTMTWTVFSDWIVAFPWIPALYTGIFSTGLCLWVEMSAMRDVSATETAIIYGLEPVWGAAFAWFLLGERWGTTGWIGAAFVLGGSLTVQLFGSSSITASDEDDDFKTDDRIILEKRKILSSSAVVVSSRKPDIFKK